MASLALDDAETFASQTRTTKDGRRITYEVTVKQNPEKARACGQGAKCNHAMPSLVELSQTDNSS